MKDNEVLVCKKDGRYMPASIWYDIDKTKFHCCNCDTDIPLKQISENIPGELRGVSEEVWQCLECGKRYFPLPEKKEA